MKINLIDDDFEKTIIMASIVEDFSVKIENQNLKKTDTFIIKVPSNFNYEDAEYLRVQFKSFFSCDVLIVYNDISIEAASIEEIIEIRNELNRILGGV